MHKICIMFFFACYLGKSNAKIQEYLDDRIVGGVDTDITKHPYQISLEYFKEHDCGGSILNKYWVVTAAHCVYKRQIDKLRIRAGTSTIEKGGTLRRISEVIVHPKFNIEGADCDIAVTKVVKPFKYRKSIKPIALADVEPSSGTPVVVTGWGSLSETGNFPSQLQEVEINIISRSVCGKQYEQIRPITKNMICAGVAQGGRDACFGDSGGPLVAEEILVGVVSWGEGCAKRNYPGVYSNIAVFKQWLDSVINGNEQQAFSNLKFIF